MTTDHSPQAMIAAADRRSGARLASLQALRGIAAIGVTALHASHHVGHAVRAPHLQRVFSPGHAGVDLFFVISGFIIFFVHGRDIGRPDRLGTFAARRFIRVVPLYWIALAAALAALALGRAGLPPPGRILGNALLVPELHPILGVAWTLHYELAFYLLFAAMIWRRRLGTALLLGWMAAILLGMAATAWRGALLDEPFGLEFGMGMGAALAVRRGWVRWPLTTACAGAVLFTASAGAEIAEWLARGDRLLLGYALGSMLLVAGLSAGEREGRLAVPGWCTVAGEASYTVYLFHVLLIGITWQMLLKLGLAGAMPPAAMFCVLVTAAIAGGIALSLSVEQPLLRFMRRTSRPTGGIVEALGQPGTGGSGIR